MRCFALGDIHGCSVALDTLLSAIDLQPQDHLITLGDYINKGPNAKAVLDTLVDLYGRGQLTPLRGNHELYLMRAAKRGKTRVRGKDLVDQKTLLSYSHTGRPVQLSDIPPEHWDFVQNCCLDWWETEQYIFVHATLAPNRPLERQREKALFWDKFTRPAPHMSGKTWICGHTPQKTGRPLNLGYAICLDTWVYGKGWLTALDLDSGQVIQANQRGEHQTAHIKDFFVDAPTRKPVRPTPVFAQLRGL